MVESRFMGSLRTFFQYFCMKVFIIKCVGKIVISAYVSVNVFLPLKSYLKKKKGALEDSMKNIRKDIKRSVVEWRV